MKKYSQGRNQFFFYFIRLLIFCLLFLYFFRYFFVSFFLSFFLSLYLFIYLFILVWKKKQLDLYEPFKTLMYVFFEVLPLFSFGYISGPFKGYIVRYGYDAALHHESRFLQVIHFRMIKREYHSLKQRYLVLYIISSFIYSFVIFICVFILFYSCTFFYFAF